MNAVAPRLGLPRETALAIHRTMVRIRAFETRVEELFLAGELPGFVHTYVGEEAIAAGVCAALEPGDQITSTHRGHGHAIAKGVTMRAIMAELYGRETGVCRGRGGSMHVADFSRGMLGANGIVAGGLGIAAGAALAAVRLGTGAVVAAFFGDGAVNKGTFHEALNLAAVHALPVVYVCENNEYAQFTSRRRTTSVEDLACRAVAYGIPGVTVDGNDAGAVHGATRAAVARARGGEGPTLLNLLTYRFGGHYVGDAEVYRDRDEVAARRAGDPIPRWEAALEGEGWLDDAARTAVWGDAEREVEDAVAFARRSADPDPDSALDLVFTRPDDA